jgi:hypothetical protein
MARDFRSRLQMWMRIFFRILATLLLIVLLAGVWLARVGLPAGMAAALMRRIDTGTFAVAAERVRVSPFKGVRLGRVALYRRGVVGAAAVEAEEIILGVDLLAVLRGVGSVQRIEVRNGEIRPKLTYGGPPRESDSAMGRLQAELELVNCRVQGVTVEAFQARLRVNAVGVYLDDMRMVLTQNGMRGTASGNLSYDIGNYLLKGHATGVMHPHLAVPVLDAWNLHGLVRLFKRFEFGDTLPECTLDFEAGTHRGDPIVVEGNVHARSAAYNGVEAMQADVALRVESEGSNTVVTLNPVSVVRRDGTGRGLIVIDLGQDTVRFDARTSLDPRLLFEAIDILQSPLWDDLAFGGLVNIDARGIVNYDTLVGTDFTAECDGTHIQYKRHAIDRCAFTMRMIDRTNMLSSVRGELYGGEVQGAARFVLPAVEGSNTAFDVALKMKNVDCKRVAAMLIKEGKNQYRGRLSGEVALRGLLGKGNRDTVHGNGVINIDDGRVFMLPIFGGLSELLTRIIPGLDFVLRQSDAFTEFRVAESRVTSETIKIEGNVLSLRGRGYCDFDKNLDAHVQVKLMKDSNVVTRLVQLVTLPFSKLFEFRLRGSLDDPHWYPENFSTDLLEKIGLKKSE